MGIIDEYSEVIIGYTRSQLDRLMLVKGLLDALNLKNNLLVCFFYFGFLVLENCPEIFCSSNA